MYFLFLLFSSPFELILLLACVYLPFVPFSPVDHGVAEEEPAKEYEGQYREPEPEDPYCEQEAAAADAYVSEGKFHQPLHERLHPMEDV